jgi:hypothetical protein
MTCHPDRSEAQWTCGSLNQLPDAHGSIALPFVIPSEAEGSAVLQAPPGNVFRGSDLGYEARRDCPELVEGADRQTSAQPGRAGASIPQHCPPAPACRPSAVGAAHFHLKPHQYSVEKHFHDGPAELQIPFDFAQGRLLASLVMSRVSVNSGLYWNPVSSLALTSAITVAMHYQSLRARERTMQFKATKVSSYQR